MATLGDDAAEHDGDGSPEHDIDEAPPVNAGQVDNQPVGRLQVGDARANQHHKGENDEQSHPNSNPAHNGESSVVEVCKNDGHQEQ